MRGASHESLARAEEALAGVSPAESLGGELFSIAKLLDGNGALRRALTDPARPKDTKVGLAQQLFGGKISPQALEILSVAVSGRWVSGRDLADALDQLSVEAEVAYADSRGKLDEVEDELFRLDRVVAVERALADKLGDRVIPVEHRQQLIRGLLEGKADVSTVRLAERAVDGRGRSFAASMRSYQVAAAARRNASIATVRVATDLSEAERTRLADALSRQYGRQVQLNVIVDPQVVGGVRVDIGDEVIDGTIAARLDEAQRRIAG
ncbi:F0F1 ATP synthase subunit delta [Kribbella pratensis]|jgi:F-type H+-transporting ATPase subunit delta|uniref:ATP synthase subunit delta n=1 Tax=Kribbella pratensis TaxID=2512112 RepID=A0A4R8BJ15_9ACTN|nr:F0F1 ATP synthase subunit delta [Kribbella pratensis]TDW54518.1 F-type H+-transporting ATPase subunit delta [Kribbella pratensis]